MISSEFSGTPYQAHSDTRRVKRLSWKLFDKAAKELLKPLINRQRLFEHLCERINRGQLVAYGVRTKPTVV